MVTTVDFQLSILKAFHEGKPVEVRRLSNFSGSDSLMLQWCSITSPEWRFNFENEEYRLKATPKEIWVNEYSYFIIGHRNREDAMRSGHHAEVTARIAVKYREVVE